MITLPRQMLVEARLPSHALADPAAETTARLEAALGGMAFSGRRLGVGVGSRGIDSLPLVVRAVVDWLRARGARPFLLPAMGSHGGATAEGQVDLLRSLGVTAESAGAPIEPAMDVVDLGPTADGVPVFISRPALEADGLVLINRVKPHTDFESPRLGSGLVKMAAIGLGKIEGAATCHRAAQTLGYERAIGEASRVARGRLPLWAGVALLEDAHHRLARVEVVPAAEVDAREPALLAQARAWMPALPFADIDVLVVDEIGKNISGAGMDTNVIGRGVDGKPFAAATGKARVIYARSLTPESHGNAVGIGLADVVSTRLVESMDRRITYTNALSALTPSTVRIPLHFDTDAECLAVAARLVGKDPAEARVVRIRSTLALDRFVASEAFAAELAERSDLAARAPAQAWPLTPGGDFDAKGDLLAEPART
ncbi:MAG TPA: lactate racemase domain-containing protein [Vicinamibacteria bacterium]|nr:lactate racemase domain-containing protein [Vicinamibacteria bacterium]